jgi:hypothetical protein
MSDYCEERLTTVVGIRIVAGRTTTVVECDVVTDR